MRTIFRKELADIFTSVRFFVLMVLALLICAATIYADYKGIRGVAGTELVFLKLFTTVTDEIPTLFSLVNFLALFLVPIVGISLGFDAISSERNSGTISRVLSQPIYRDSIINGKFLAGLVTLSVMVITTVMLIAGIGLRMIGIPPSADEVLRLFIYIFYTIVSGAFWMGMAMLFSTIFRRTSTALLLSVGLWLFFGIFYIFLVAPTIANAISPAGGDAASIVANMELTGTLLRFSPNYLYLEASMVLLEPPVAGSLLGVIGVLASGQAQWMIPSILSLGQTLILVWPHLTSLLALTVITFAANYIILTRQEIRST